MAQRNYVISTTALSLTPSGTTAGSGNTQSASFVVARTLVRTGLTAGELQSGSQTWALHYVVSSMVTPYEMRLKVQRRNSGGTMQAESGYGTVRSANGTYDDNLTADLGTWAADDQLAIVWEHRRPSGSGNKSASLDANGSSYVDAPAITNLTVNLATGNAAGSGKSASISSPPPALTVNLATGNAAAVGSGANLTTEVTVSLVVGNAPAAGQQLSVSAPPPDITINLQTGNAAGSGKQASVSSVANIAFSNLGNSASPDGWVGSGTSMVTASWTPPTSGLIIVGVASRQASGNQQPTMSGNGLTWTFITKAINGVWQLSLFGANASGSSAGATTIDFAGVSQVFIGATFFAATGVDLTGGVAAAFVQSPTNTAGSQNNISVSLASPASSNNRPIAVVQHAANEVTDHRTNWTELDDVLASSRGLESQYRNDAFETTASASWASFVQSIIIAAELKAGGGGSSPQTVNLATGAAVGSGKQAGVTATVTRTMATGAATSTGLQLGVTAEVTRTMAVGNAAGSGKQLSVSNGGGAAQQVNLATGLAIAQGQQADAQPGPVAPPLATGSAIGSGKALTVTPGPVIRTMATGSAVGSGKTAQVTNITGATIPLTTGSAVASGKIATVTPGPVVRSVNTGQATAQGHQLAVTAEVTVAMLPGLATAAGHQATITNLAEGEVPLQVGQAFAAGLPILVSVLTPDGRTIRVKGENRGSTAGDSGRVYKVEQEWRG